MSNKKIDGPPLNQPVNDLNNKLTYDWARWFDDNHYYNLSERNFQRITAASAINLDAKHVSITEATGGYAITLAAPTVAGRWKIIQMIARNAGAVTLALTNVVGGSAATSASFDAVNETLVLLSLTDKWLVIKEHGVTLS